MEEATIAKIATEALKPVSSIIDTLLGPKLKRMKAWAEKRDLNNRLGSTIMDVLLDQYLRRLLRRICGITTIVFPQQVLPLTEIYEPLYLEERYKSTSSKKSAFHVSMLEKGRNFLIVDLAGMGKSTFAKHLVLEVLSATNKIPIFLELNRIADEESLIQKLALDMDEAKNDIDEKLLPLWFEMGNFVIILDGFDEVPEHLRGKIGKQIKELAVWCENNSLILTARPEVPLPDLPDSKVLTIKPLTKTQAKSLVLRYDAVANIDIGKKLVNEFSAVPEAFLQIPLLVALLYRTYGFNQSIATRISSFYDEVYNALYKGHDLTKAGFCRAKSSQLDSEEFRRLLRGFSFLLAVRQKARLKSKTEGITIIDEAIKLTEVKPSSPALFFDDLLLAVPLLMKDGNDFRFIHKSIGEYFAAEFLVYQSGAEQIVERIRDSHLAPSFSTTFDYLSEINPSLFRRLIVAPLAKSILAEVNPIQNSLIRTICFLMSAELGLWPYEKYVRRGKEGRTEFDLPESKAHHNAIFFHYGNLRGNDCILALTFTGKVSQPPPAAAWEAVTIKTKKFALDRNDSPSLDELGQNIPLEEWIPIDDERVLNKANSPVMAAVFEELLGLETSSFARTSNVRHEIRVLDETSCRNLLKQIEQENETQAWLQGLIPSKRKRH